MPDMLEAQLCDVLGEPVAGGTIVHTVEGGGLSVRIPLNDSRTASVTLSAYDRAARHARVLDRVLSITFGPYLIFKGQIVQVSTDYAAGTCTISAMDPSLRLKHAYHRYGDYAVSTGYPIDWLGVRRLIESAIPTGDQIARGVPPLPIQWGNDDTTHQPPRDEGGIWRKAKRHANVWETVQNLSQALIGPDFRIRPVDKQHPGFGTLPWEGYYARLDTATTLGDDLSDTIIFEHGLGQDSAENLVHEPDGELVRNHFTQVYPGGQRGSGDAERKAVAANHQSQEDYGLMEGLESSGQTDTQEVLQEKAKAMIRAYHRSPNFFTVTPRLSRASVPQYRRDWDVGDTIRARAVKGNREVDLVGRIITATISAVDQSGNTRADLECVPHIPGDLDPDD